MQESGFQLDRYLRLVWERRTLLVVVALLVATLSVAVCYVLPKKYKAESTVFIEQNVINELVKGIAITPSMTAKVKALSVTMLSRTMLTDVAKKLDLDLQANTPRKLENLIEGLRSRTQIALNERQGVFLISFTDTSPILARDYVNTLTRTYIEGSTSEKREESYEATKFLGDQIDVFKQRIDAAQANIDKFRAEKGSLLSQDEGVVNKEIQDIDSQLEQMRLKRNEIVAHRNVMLRNTASSQRLDELESQLRALRVNYTDNHPKVLRLKEEIAALERRADRDRNREQALIRRTPAYEQVRVSLASLDSMIGNLEQEREQKKELLREIPSVRTEYNELVRKKQNEEIIYEKLVSRYGQSEVSKQMELQDKSVTFRVVDPAVTPTVPESPKRPLIILAGIMFGIAAGVGLIVLLDLLDRSVKDPETLEETGLPVLAVVPKMEDPAVIEKRRRSDRRLAIVGGAYASLILVVLALEVLRVPVMDRLIAGVARTLT